VLEVLETAAHMAAMALTEAHRDLESEEVLESPDHTPEEAYASAILLCLSALCPFGSGA
jgi:hypothetical protein